MISRKTSPKQNSLYKVRKYLFEIQDGFHKENVPRTTVCLYLLQKELFPDVWIEDPVSQRRALLECRQKLYKKLYDLINPINSSNIDIYSTLTELKSTIDYLIQYIDTKCPEIFKDLEN